MTDGVGQPLIGHLRITGPGLMGRARALWKMGEGKAMCCGIGSCLPLLLLRAPGLEDVLVNKEMNEQQEVRRVHHRPGIEVVHIVAARVPCDGSREDWPWNVTFPMHQHSAIPRNGPEKNLHGPQNDPGIPDLTPQ